MKFKVGDKVKTEHGNGVIVFFDKSDETYLVKVQGFKGHRGSSGYINEDSESDKWWFYEGDLELINQDLRELLQVGYKVEYKFCNPHKMTIEIGNEEYLALIKKHVNQDLIDSEEDIFTINAIYRPKYNGLKPMEWVLVWERGEKLFTLQCPITNEYLYKNQLNEYVWEIIGEKFTQK